MLNIINGQGSWLHIFKSLRNRRSLRYFSSLQKAERIGPSLGDFVQVRRNGKCYAGLVQQKVRRNRWNMQIASGADFSFGEELVAFWLPQSEHQTSPLNFIQNAEKLLAEKKESFQDVYRYMHLENQKNTITSKEVAEYVFSKPEPSSEEVYAAHCYLIDQPLFFIVNKPFSFKSSSMEFICRNTKDAQRLQSQLRKARKEDAEFKQFITKLVYLLRHKPADFTCLTLKDKDWIRTVVMHASLGNGDPMYELITERILSQFNLPIEPEGSRKLLVDCGMWNDHVHAELLPLLIGGCDVYRYEQDNIAKKDRMSTLIDVMKPVDLLSQLRQPFINTALAIDNTSVHEVDDAISITNDPADLANPWIHIHVADPSCMIPAKSELAEQIVRTAVNIYLPDRVINMMPEQISQAMSLSSGAKKPSMTVSVKLNDKGDITNVKLGASSLERIEQLSYARVDRYFKNCGVTNQTGTRCPFYGPDFVIPQEWAYKSSYSGENPNQHQLNDIPTDISTLLDCIYKAAKQHYAWRVEQNAFTMFLPSSKVTIDQKQILPHETLNQQGASLVTPGINVCIENSYTSVGRSMVAEMMVLAGRAVGIYASEANIPVIYRTQGPVEDPWSHYAVNGAILPQNCFNLIGKVPSAVLTCMPDSKHSSLGIENYVQFTSPLRRAQDLVSHWQLKAHLAGRSVPYSEREINSFIEQIVTAQRRASRIQRMQNVHWIKEYIKLQLKTNPSEPPLYDAYIISKLPDQSVEVFIKDVVIRTFVPGDSVSPCSNSGQWVKISPRLDARKHLTFRQEF